MRILAGTATGDDGVHVERLDRCGDLAEQAHEGLALLVVEDGELVGVEGGDLGEVGVDDRVGGVCQLDEDDAAVRGIRHPADKALALERVDE